MLKYFRGSAIFTICSLILAYMWAMYRHPGSEMLCIFIVLFLSILEITLSFDNAVVNALKLEKMTKKWQHRFVTWGIVVAVFGMRLLFPLVVVAIFANLSLIDVGKLAIFDVDKYENYLKACHSSLVTFGGSFLFMLFLSYFCSENKDVHWIAPVEKILQKCHLVKSTESFVTLLIVTGVSLVMPDDLRFRIFLSGLSGILLYILIDGLSNWLEGVAQKRASLTGEVAKLGFVGFVYLELIDASFSLDGVLGAFAISRDIIIIMIGLAIGAMFVRSLTIFMLEMKTLKTFIYLEHGAHWAIGFLAIIMFFSTQIEVPEVVTGLTGLVIVGAAFLDSVRHNKQQKLQDSQNTQKLQTEQQQQIQ